MVAVETTCWHTLPFLPFLPLPRPMELQGVVWSYLYVVADASYLMDCTLLLHWTLPSISHLKSC